MYTYTHVECLRHLQEHGYSGRFSVKKGPELYQNRSVAAAMAVSSTTGLSFFWLELGNRMGNRNKFELFPMGWLPAVDSIFNGLLCLRAFAKLRGERPDDEVLQHLD